jgi:cation transport ATPase
MDTAVVISAPDVVISAPDDHETSRLLLFTVRGLTCADCSSRLEARLRTDPRVSSAAVSDLTASARVRLHASTGAADAAAALVASAAVLGFPMTLRPRAGARFFLRAPRAADVGARAAWLARIAERAARMPNVAGAARTRACAAADCGARAAVPYDAHLVGARHALGALARADGDAGAADARACTHGGDDGDAVADEDDGEGGCARVVSRARHSPNARLGAACAITAASLALSFARGDAELLTSGALTRGVAAQLALSILTMVTYWRAHAAAAIRTALTAHTASYDTLVAISSAASFVLGAALIIAAWADTDVSAYGEPPFAATATLLGVVAIAAELDARARAATRGALDALRAREGGGGRVAVQAPCATAACDAASCKDCATGWALATVPESADAAAPTTPAAADPPAPLVAASLLHVNDEILVARDELIAADGVLVSDDGAADESMLTGESAAVAKRAGDGVFGGTRNAGGTPLRVRLAALPGAGALARIVALIGDAQAARPAVAARLDAVARVFTPLALAASLATLGAWWGAAAAGRANGPDGAPFSVALNFALALLVVACPCALALAVAPVALVATTVAARAGVLLAGGGAALESAARVDCVILDKTGTLTEGRASVMRVVVSARAATHAAAAALGVAPPPRGAAAAAQKSSAPTAAGAPPAPPAPAALSTDAALLLGAAAAVALASSHPLSAAIRRAAIAARVALPDSACRGEERHATAGRGVRAVAAGGEELLLGAPAWIEAEGVAGAAAAAAPARDAGRSVVALSIDGELAGVIELDDAVRAGAAMLLDALRARGCARVLIASGDGAGAVERAADAAGVPRADARAGLTPEGKVALVRTEQAAGRIVAFVGDGVNDAAALAAADVGVAMAGGDAATRGAAAAVLQRDDLGGLLRLLRLARAARALVVANVVYAFVYNAFAMPLAAGAFYPIAGVVIIPPAYAGVSEILSTMPVLLCANLLWLLRL